MCSGEEQGLLNENETLKIIDDKLINQTSHRYVISVIHLLVSLINARYQ